MGAYMSEQALSIIAAALVTYSVKLGLGRHTAAVLAEGGEEQLVLTAKWQIFGYRMYDSCGMESGQ